ncbi:hypothetical protein [Shewanella sp. SG41-4]|uniref:hypothetical protein n=1 Tax=Shewanella TaxID=22 RepID=UPI0015FF37C9|nr:hypothetical protein [Shewanella sp. SG41-4]MBB1438561.1 hypothetical protein [Shewanella sp. SG41-4]
MEIALKKISIISQCIAVFLALLFIFNQQALPALLVMIVPVFFWCFTAVLLEQL